MLARQAVIQGALIVGRSICLVWNIRRLRAHGQAAHHILEHLLRVHHCILSSCVAIHERVPEACLIMITLCVQVN